MHLGFRGYSGMNPATMVGRARAVARGPWPALLVIPSHQPPAFDRSSSTHTQFGPLNVDHHGANDLELREPGGPIRATSLAHCH